MSRRRHLMNPADDWAPLPRDPGTRMRQFPALCGKLLTIVPMLETSPGQSICQHCEALGAAMGLEAVP